MEVYSELCGALLNSGCSGGGECAAHGADSAGLASALQEEELPRRVVKFVDEVASPRSDHVLDSRPDSVISRFLMLNAYTWCRPETSQTDAHDSSTRDESSTRQSTADEVISRLHSTPATLNLCC
jgi:hypothetical protein